MRSFTWFLIAAIVAACAHHASTAAAPPSRIGIYRFTERPPQLQQVIEGRIIVTHDSVIVDAQPGPCRYDGQASNASGPIVYHCAEITLSFDRFDPVGRATYRTTTTVTEHHTICVRYTTDASGRQVCAQQQTETSERQVPVAGTLHMESITRPN